MTTPTREQVIAAPIESYSAEDLAFYAFWYAHMKDDMMQPPLNTVHHAVAKLIYTAGRDQGLREAKEVAESCVLTLATLAGEVRDTDRSMSLAIMAKVHDIRAAIEQLRGK